MYETSQEDRDELSEKQPPKLLNELGQVGVSEQRELSHRTLFSSYLTSYQRSYWIYLILVASSVETLLVEYGSGSTILIAFRIALGLLILGFLPGYTSQRALFPVGEITVLERVLLSVFLSIIISISLGTILGFLLVFRPVENAVALNLYIVLTTLLAGYRSSLRQKETVSG